MKSFPRAQRILVSAVLASLTVIHCGRAAEGPASVTTLDPAFPAGFARLKRATGFIEDQPNQSPTNWKPNLQLWVGVKAVEGSKRTIYFVQLTTLPPPPTNSLGQPWQPILRTNNWAWSPSNKTQFVTPLYPVRARVFDESGRQLKEGQTPMAWGMLTNGLMDMCRLGFEAYHDNNQGDQPLTPSPSSLPSPPLGEKVPAGRLRGNLSPSDPSSEALRRVGGERVATRPGEGKKSAAPKPQENEELMRAMGGGFLWMIGMFSDLQTVPSVANVWAKAQCAIRWPSAWTIATSLVKGFTVSLEPRLKEVTLANAATAGNAGPFYRLPVDLNSGKRNLSRVEIIVGPAHGAEMLLAGIRSIRAKHPAKLAAGTVREP